MRGERKAGAAGCIRQTVTSMAMAKRERTSSRPSSGRRQSKKGIKGTLTLRHAEEEAAKKRERKVPSKPKLLTARLRFFCFFLLPNFPAKVENCSDTFGFCVHCMIRVHHGNPELELSNAFQLVVPLGSGFQFARVVMLPLLLHQRRHRQQQEHEQQCGRQCMHEIPKSCAHTQ